MALDFHKADNNEYLFGLNDSQYANIEAIFTEFKQRSGIYIDPYRDTKLTVDNQKVMVQVINVYINKMNLNINKQKTVDIIEFRALIKYFSNKEIEIKIVGD